MPGTSEKYVNDLNQHLKNNEQSIFSQSDVNEAFDIFNEHFLEVINVYAPMTISKTKSKCPQWFCNKLKNLKTKRTKAHRKWKENQCEPPLAAFTKARDNLKKEIITTKKQFYHNNFDKCIGNSRQTYKLLNELKGKTNASETIPILSSCQKNIEEPSHVDNATSFNDFFINIGSNLTKHPKKNTRLRLKSNAYSMLYKTKSSEIQKIMQDLDNKSS